MNTLSAAGVGNVVVTHSVGHAALKMLIIQKR